MYFDGIRVSFVLEERDCSLTRKAEAPPGTEGTLWGDSFQGGPECSLSAKAADQGRRCRQREQERTREKRTIRYWEVLRKNAETFFDKMDGICLPR